MQSDTIPSLFTLKKSDLTHTQSGISFDITLLTIAQIRRNGSKKTIKTLNTVQLLMKKTLLEPLQIYQQLSAVTYLFGKLPIIMTTTKSPNTWAEILSAPSKMKLTFAHYVSFLLSLAYVRTLEMYITLYSTPKQISATSTGFFNETVHNMRKKIADKDEVSWNIYSAHDTTVGNMLAALNLTNVDCIYEAYLKKTTQDTDTCVTNYPAFTANIIF